MLYRCGMEENGIDIAGFVKAVRKKLGLSQLQLADWMGCTKGNVSGWENNHHQPSYEQMCQMSFKSKIPLPTYKEPYESLPEKQKDIIYINEMLNEMSEAEVKENKSHVEFVRFTKIKREDGKKVNDDQ